MANIIAEIIQHDQCGFCKKLKRFKDTDKENIYLNVCLESTDKGIPKLIKITKGYGINPEIPDWCSLLAESQEKLKALDGALSK
jgi:hypothetical protein